MIGHAERIRARYHPWERNRRSLEMVLLLAIPHALDDGTKHTALRMRLHEDKES